MSDLLFEGHGWKIQFVEGNLPDGRVKKIARATICDTVHILAFPTKETVLILREFRPIYGTYVWMVPSGKVDKETDPYGAAQRELQEETGFKSKDLSPYFTSKYSERLQYTAHVYLAKDLIAEPLPQDDTELIEVHELPLTEALEKVLKSDCTHTMSAFALLHYKHDLENGMWKTW